MAVSGSQFTRIGASISGVGIRLDISPKVEGLEVIVKNRGMLAAQHVRRKMHRR